MARPLTLREAGDQYGRSPEYLRAAIKAGKIRAQKYGRDWYVVAEEMERYVAETRRGRPPGSLRIEKG